MNAYTAYFLLHFTIKHMRRWAKIFLPGAWLLHPPTVCPPDVFPLGLTTVTSAPPAWKNHRYVASPGRDRWSDCPSTIGRLCACMGILYVHHRRESNLCPPEQKTSEQPLMPFMHVSWIPSQRRQSKWLGRRP